MPWETLIAVLGSLLGVFVGIKSSQKKDEVKYENQKKETLTALIAEISVVIELLGAKKQYVTILESNLERWEKEPHVNPVFPKILATDMKTDEIYKTLIPVYMTMLPRLGLLQLDKLQPISEFYMRLMYVLYEWTLFSSSEFWGRDHERSSKIKIVKSNLNALHEALQIGRKIIGESSLNN